MTPAAPSPAIPYGMTRDDCLSYAAWTLWYLGYPDQALKRSQEAVALAAGLSHLLVWLMPWRVLLFHLSAGRSRSPKSGQRR